MTCKRGDVALVPFPFSDLSATKRRPVLVLTDADGYGDFLAVGVTSRPHHSNAIALTEADMIEGRLPVASWVRVDRVVTLNLSVVAKVFGCVGNEYVERAVKAVCARVEINMSQTGDVSASWLGSS
jgi:mRNA interferase MazF